MENSCACGLAWLCSSSYNRRRPEPRRQRRSVMVLVVCVRHSTRLLDGLGWLRMVASGTSRRRFLFNFQFSFSFRVFLLAVSTHSRCSLLTRHARACIFYALVVARCRWLALSSCANTLIVMPIEIGMRHAIGSARHGQMQEHLQQLGVLKVTFDREGSTTIQSYWFYGYAMRPA